MEIEYKSKYLKYKTKYLALKNNELSQMENIEGGVKKLKIWA